MGIRYNIYEGEIGQKDFFQALMSNFPWNCPDMSDMRGDKNFFVPITIWFLIANC